MTDLAVGAIHESPARGCISSRCAAEWLLCKSGLLLIGTAYPGNTPEEAWASYKAFWAWFPGKK